MIQTRTRIKKVPLLISVILIISILLGICYLVFHLRPITNGKIQKVTVSKNEEDYQKKALFKKTDSPFNYDYQTITDRRFLITFKAPKSWKVTKGNDRHYVLQAPVEDPYLPGVTMNIFFSNQILNMYANTTGSYSEIFSRDIRSATYYIDGKYTSPSTYQMPDTITTDSTISNGNKEKLSYAVTKNVSMDKLSEKASGSDYFVNWYGYPCVFSSYVEKSDLKNIKKLQRYIVSNLGYTEPKIETVKTISTSRISFSIPATFEESQENKGVYMAPLSSKDGLSGMSVSISEVNLKKSASVSVNSMNETYGLSLMFSSLDDQGISNYHQTFSCQSEETFTVGEIEARVYSSQFNIDREDLSLGEPFYEDGSTYFMETYVIPVSRSKETVINFTYEMSQKDTAKKIRKIIEKSIRTR